MDVKSISKRLDELLTKADRASSPTQFTEVYHGTVTVVQAMYGVNSSHEKDLTAYVGRFRDSYHPTSGNFCTELIPVIKGRLEAMKAEVAAGFFGSLQSSITGDVLSDLIKLSKSVLEDVGDDAKNVAAVLAAAAFEDTVRRVSAKHHIADMDKLADLITEMKNQQVLQGPQVGIAQSYLSFRNKALHAKWAEIDRSSVHSVLAFTEQLIMIHLS